jgi:hypothetical protein
VTRDEENARLSAKRVGTNVSSATTCGTRAPRHPRAHSPRRTQPTRPRGRIPRVARLLALAHHFEELLATDAVETQAELAELAKLTPARVTQIMNLLSLAPDIQEASTTGKRPGTRHRFSEHYGGEPAPGPLSSSGSLRSISSGTSPE